ncbi:LysR substrate-binding domain-containing protein [Agrococcus sp. Ld7]|uniref:LysR substrate-binding domain-containing protein n=1 Tax=Agrococcus sp. Ld7 TaxID=649148 RepID=UPI00386A2696
MLDVRRLRLLRELRLRGTIAAVATALAYAPSAVSQQLTALEREVGVPLTRKQGRRLALTPQGEVLAQHAEGILAQLETAERAVAASLDRPIGTVRIAVFQSAALSLVPSMLHLLGESAPEVRVEMVQREPETALYDTHVGDFDLVVAEQYPGHAAPQHLGLDREVLMTDALRLAVPPHSGIRSLADAAAHPWVMEPLGAASRHFGEQQCRVAGFEPDVRFATADLQAQMRLIETGHAVGIMNDLTWVGTDVRFVALALPGAPRREIFTAARAASSGSPAIAAVRAALRGAVPDEVARD